MLRFLFLFVWISGALSFYAQEVPVQNNANVLNNATNSIQEVEAEEFRDTVSYDIEKIDKAKPVRRNKVNTQKIDERSWGAAPASESQRDQPTISAQDRDAYSATSSYAEKAKVNFSVSKTQATYNTQQRTPVPEVQLKMDQTVAYFEQMAPNSFEYHYFKYTAGNYNISEITHLRKAEKMMPENTDVHAQMAAYKIITRDADSAAIYIQKLLNSGRLNENTLHYAEDLLLSVPENGVLITHGFDDMYSTWKKRYVDNVRPDVTLISLDFLQSDYYRSRLTKDGFVLPKEDVINVDYLQSFCHLNASKPISISLTTPKEYFVPIKSQLYITGLVFEYHQEAFNNFDRNNVLWNSILRKHLVDFATDEKSKQLSSNYLPMLLQLRKVYGQQGEQKNLRDVDKTIDKVSLQCKKYNQVQKLKSSY